MAVSRTKHAKANAQPGDQVFAENAADYQRLGLAVIPTGGETGKKPLVAGFNKWKHSPGEEAVRRWIGQHPSANIALVAGPSRLTVVDIDDADHIGLCIDRFGDTPLQVSTPSGGLHLYYRSSGEGNRNLRAEGLDVDIKGVGGIVLLPPSRSPETGNAYSFVCGGLETYAVLPAVKAGSLSPKRRSKKKPSDKRPRDMVEGDGRNLALFEQLLVIAARPDTSYESLMTQAESINSGFREPMDDREMQGVVDSVWKYKEQGTLLTPGERAAMIRHEDYELLRGDPDAVALWVDISMEHVGRDHEFALDVEKMRERLGMSSDRAFREARDRLTLKYKLIVQTKEGGHGPRDPHLFMIRPRRSLRVLR